MSERANAKGGGAHNPRSLEPRSLEPSSPEPLPSVSSDACERNLSPVPLLSSNFRALGRSVQAALAKRMIGTLRASLAFAHPDPAAGLSFKRPR